MKKKLLSILMALSLCLSLMPAAVLAAEEHTCVDSDGDYWCDTCWEIVEHTCFDKDGDLCCDVCWEPAEHTCFDEDGDYWCDGCWEILDHTCVDESAEKEDPADHYCALCGEHMVELCTSEDGDHSCDICWVILEGLCSDEDNDHFCDNENCSNSLTDCEDTEGDDNVCDICGKGIYPDAGELNVEDEVGDGTITITWSALEDVGTDRVVSYTVHCYDAEGDMEDAVSTTYDAAEAPFTHTFTGLTNDVTYYVGVTASYAPQADDEDSQFTATMEILATPYSTMLSTTTSAFTDVQTDSYYYDAVNWAVANGITNGTSDTTFSPDTSCTRAQMATFLWRAAGSPNPVESVSPFTDVPADAYYAAAVQWAYEQGITGGTSATTFSPDASCTRAQMATFLWRNAGSPTPEGSASPFTDVPADVYYTQAVQWAYEQGITGGTSATTFSPDASCTRAQMVTFLYRFFGA